MKGNADRPGGITFAEVADSIIDIHWLVLDVDGRIMIFVIGFSKPGIMTVERDTRSEADYVGREVVIIELCASIETYFCIDIDRLRRQAGQAAMNTHLEQVFGMGH